MPDITPEPMFDVVAVDFRTKKARIMATNKTAANAEAFIDMAIMRRGVEFEYYKAVPADTVSDAAQAVTELRFDPKTCTISPPNGRVAAYMAQSAHEADPTLGYEMAAAPALVEASTRLLARYVSLAGSGDCGFWDPETETEVIAMRAALALAATP